MRRMARSIALLSALLGLSACAEGRWVHPTHTEDQAKQDWEICKAEVLSGQQHAKDRWPAASTCPAACGQKAIPTSKPGPSSPLPLLTRSLASPFDR